LSAAALTLALVWLPVDPWPRQVDGPRLAPVSRTGHPAVAW